MSLWIGQQSNLAVCGIAECVSSARLRVAELSPDLVMMDLRLGAGDTLELIKTFKAQYPEMPVLVFSQFNETSHAERALRAGARGFVQKQEPAAEVVLAIQTVLQGGMYVSRQVAVLILQRSFSFPIHPLETGESAYRKLSDRELHVFQLLGLGRSTRQIALELKLSVKTIETHRENIKHKLGISNGVHLNKCASDWVGKQSPSGVPDELPGTTQENC
jgi:DNA-binding NarL/FixJ family response regulator